MTSWVFTASWVRYNLWQLYINNETNRSWPWIGFALTPIEKIIPR